MRVLLVYVIFYFYFALVVFPALLITFIPVLPIMLLAFPMIFFDENHWSCKPYMWYFKNVWLRVVKLIEIKF